MSLRIRRGTEAQRTSVVFDSGELVVTTDEFRLFVGDGITAGGRNIAEQLAGTNIEFNQTTGKLDANVTGITTDNVAQGTINKYFSNELAQDAAASLLVNGIHQGISFVYNNAQDEVNRIDATVSLSLENLTDVVIGGTPTDGYVLKYDSAAESWIPGPAADVGNINLNDLADVVIAGTPTIGQVLQYDESGFWTTGTLPEAVLTLNDLTDVVIASTPTDGQVLKYDLGTSTWIPGTTVSGLGDLTDVNLNVEILDGQVLKYNAETSSWLPADDLVGIMGLSEDLSPALGGNLDLNFANIVGNGNIDITGSLTIDEIFTSDFGIGIQVNSKIGNTFCVNYYEGTRDNPMAIASGNVVGAISIKGYNGTIYAPAGSIFSTWESNSDPESLYPSSTVNIAAGTNSENPVIATLNSAGTFSAPSLQTGVYTSNPETRPSNPAKGMIIFNDTTGQFEGYNGTTWTDYAGLVAAPTSSKGAAGDTVGMIAADANYLYVCVATYTDGLTDIWSRTAVTASTW